MITSPVLFLIFNRPDTTRRVFEAIRTAQPQKLFIAADGPRLNVESDYEQCTATRSIAMNVDWECEVYTLFRDTNLGCKAAVSSAIDWFFEHVEEGIILEDDCLPDQTFFRFCDELLDKYRHDTRIGMISGDNFLFGQRNIEGSYYFSRYTHIWGWATWRRAWQKYDVSLSGWPKFREQKLLRHVLDNDEEVEYWTAIFDNTYLGHINTWDYQLMFSSWANGFVNIIPNSNMVQNDGYK